MQNTVVTIDRYGLLLLILLLVLEYRLLVLVLHRLVTTEVMFASMEHPHTWGHTYMTIKGTA